LFQKPAITGFYPTKGPLSGGTLLTVYGTDLDAGRNVQVVLMNIVLKIAICNDHEFRINDSVFFAILLLCYFSLFH